MINKNYKYVYTVCFYTGGTEWRSNNLKSHLYFVSNYSHLSDGTQKVLFVVAMRGESKAIQQEIEAICSEHNTRKDYIDVLILPGPNWGMMVGGLWDTWRYLQDNHVSFEYMVANEDDWLHNHWPEREALLEQGYIYIGMFSHVNLNGDTEFYRKALSAGYKQDDKVLGWGRICSHVKTPFRYWTDGGLYMLKEDGLKKIEQEIGCFTKAPPLFDRSTHGVDFGEVGFPTELFVHGFRFQAYLRHSALDEQLRYFDFSTRGPHHSFTPEFYQDKTWVYMVGAEGVHPDTLKFIR